MGWTIHVLSSGMGKAIFPSKMSRLALGPTQPPMQRSSRVKQWRYVAHHLLPFSGLALYAYKAWAVPLRFTICQSYSLIWMAKFNIKQFYAHANF